MRKSWIAVALMVLVLGVGSVAKADDAGSTWTLHGWYITPDVEAFVPFNSDLSTTVFAGAHVGYQWNEWISLEVESGWANPDLSSNVGDVTTIPLLFNVRWNIFPGVYMVDPYVFGGLGIAFNDINVDDSAVQIDDSFAGQIGAGFDYQINEYLSAGLEMRFYFNDPDVNVPVLGEKDVELNSLLVGGTVRWSF